AETSRHGIDHDKRKQEIRDCTKGRRTPDHSGSALCLAPAIQQRRGLGSGFSYRRINTELRSNHESESSLSRRAAFQILQSHRYAPSRSGHYTERPRADHEGGPGKPGVSEDCRDQELSLEKLDMGGHHG